MATRAVTLPRVPTSKHAVERFVRRLRPDLSIDTDAGLVAAELELWGLLAEATFARGWPTWLPLGALKGYRGHFETVDRHGRDVILPVVQRENRSEAITTVLVRGWDGDDG